MGHLLVSGCILFYAGSGYLDFVMLSEEVIIVLFAKSDCGF